MQYNSKWVFPSLFLSRWSITSLVWRRAWVLVSVSHPIFPVCVDRRRESCIPCTQCNLLDESCSLHPIRGKIMERNNDRDLNPNDYFQRHRCLWCKGSMALWGCSRGAQSTFQESIPTLLRQNDNSPTAQWPTRIPWSGDSGGSIGFSTVGWLWWAINETEER